jgi:hypothetical protein|nr:hypothetical protein [Neorhizobium tomejilense]
MQKPSIPQVVARFAAYYELPGNGAWGSLHIVLDDGNVSNGNVEFCIEAAADSGDEEGRQLAEILLAMSRTQRAKLPQAVDAYLAAQKAAIPSA